MQVNEQIYAVGTYSCLTLALVMLLVTDYFRYKPLIVADGIAGIFTYALLLGSPSIERVKVSCWSLNVPPGTKCNISLWRF